MTVEDKLENFYKDIRENWLKEDRTFIIQRNFENILFRRVLSNLERVHSPFIVFVGSNFVTRFLIHIGIELEKHKADDNPEKIIEFVKSRFKDFLNYEAL